ncbi:TPA: transcriptional regulator [Escherichia coli]|nr:transcriptional regulator [Escherichia coli]HAW2552735.1 transcriptional regulator [Escherichia coli]HAW2557495.1 transcriptional regulator [Escherichia coli]HAW2582039.1 transcriptional regulator [Escherichia coli]
MQLRKDYLVLTKTQRTIIPGALSEVHFWLLTEVSPIHSEKAIRALRDHLVLGYTRKEACERNGMSAGYFSVVLKRFLRVDLIVSQVASYYMQQKNEENDRDRERYLSVGG